MAHYRKDAGVELIIGYKVARSVVSLIGALAVVLVTTTGHAAAFGALAEALRRHAVGAWSISLSEAFSRAVSPQHLSFIAAALTLDGAFTAVEGWALHRGAAWGHWLVVVATSTFIPFEIAALARHPAIGRALVLAVNVAIVAYLGRRAAHEVAIRARGGL